MKALELKGEGPLLLKPGGRFNIRGRNFKTVFESRSFHKSRRINRLFIQGNTEAPDRAQISAGLLISTQVSLSGL